MRRSLPSRSTSIESCTRANRAEEADPNAAIPTWLGGSLGSRPTVGQLDNPPHPPESNKFVDTGQPGFRVPQSAADYPVRNENEYFSKADAEAAVELLRKKDPPGNYLIVDASPWHDLWVVARVGEAAEQVFDSTSQNRPT
jgi:hypothetical protein